MYSITRILAEYAEKGSKSLGRHFKEFYTPKWRSLENMNDSEAYDQIGKWLLHKGYVNILPPKVKDFETEAVNIEPKRNNTIEVVYNNNYTPTYTEEGELIPNIENKPKTSTTSRVLWM